MNERWTAAGDRVCDVAGDTRAECYAPNGTSTQALPADEYEKGCEALAVDIAARLNGPSPAEVAALLRDIGHGHCGSCDRRVCPSCSADLDIVTSDRPDGKCFADCKLNAMIKQCEGV